MNVKSIFPIIFFLLITKTLFAQSSNNSTYGNNKKVLDSIHNFNAQATSEIGRNRYGRAIPILEKEQTLINKIHLQNSAEYQTSLELLGSAYKNVGAFQYAKDEFEEYIKIIAAREGTDNLTYGLAVRDLAVVDMRLGNRYYAEKEFKDALSIVSTWHGDHSAQYLSVLCDQSYFHMISQKEELATDEIKSAQNIYKELLAKGQPILKGTVARMGQVFCGVVNMDMGLSLLNDALKDYEHNEAHDDDYCNILLCKGILQWHKDGLSQNTVDQFIKISENNTRLFIKNIEGLDEKEIMLLKPQLSYSNDILFSILEKNSHNSNLLSAALKSELLFKGVTLRLFSKDGNSSSSQISNEQISGALNDIKQSLTNLEIAIDFVKFRYWDVSITGKMEYAAILISHDSPSLFIPLFEQNELTDLMYDNDNGDLKSYINLYATKDNNKTGNITDLNRSLTNLIWQKIMPYVKNRSTIYYSPEGSLNYISMPSLSYGKGCMGDLYHFVSLQNITSIKDYKQEQSTSTQTFSLVGGINYEPNKRIGSKIDSILSLMDNVNEQVNQAQQGTELYEEPYEYLSENEIKTISKIITSNGKFVKAYLTDTFATRKAFISLQQRQTDVLHISTHGFYYPDNAQHIYKPSSLKGMFRFSENPMERCGLALSYANERITRGNYDELITANEIADMNLSKTKLVVLSACESGKGQFAYGEGVYGLQRAFKMAGAKYVLMNLYEISETNSEKFMTTFYTKLMNNKSVEIAFIETQKQLRETDTDKLHPNAWCSWILTR